MKRILIVDDSKWMCEAIATHIGQEHNQVEMTSDPHQAVAMLQQDPYDLLITDFNMPTMDGLQLIDKVRNQLELIALPIVVLSVEFDDAIRQKAKRLGVKHWVTKPIDDNKLQQVVNFLMQK